MVEPNEAVMRRIERLEKSNRRMKLVAIAGIALLSLGAAPKVPDVVQAKRFQVVAGNGKVLVDIGPFGDNDHPSMIFFDKKGVVRESIGIDAFSDDSGVFSFDHNGTLRTGSLAIETGTLAGVSAHFVNDNNGVSRTVMNFDPVDDFTGFATSDGNGVVRVTAGTELTTPIGFMNLHDGNGTLRASLASDFDPTGGTGIAFADNTGTFRAAMNIDSTQSGGFGNEAFALANPQSKLVGTVLSPPGQGGTFTSYDANGNSTGHLP